MNDIRFLVMDVDGTLTDGKIYIGNEGEILKAFHVKDGYGIKVVLPKYNIVPVILTARSSNIVLMRCNELGINEVYQNTNNKLEALREIIRKYSERENRPYDLKNVAYCGDDLIDYECMENIKNYGGTIGCPFDAVDEIKEICNFVSGRKGGEGAVRDFISFITLQMNQR